jgi:hypothetical protein
MTSIVTRVVSPKRLTNRIQKEYTMDSVSSTEITLYTYSHVLPGPQKAAGERFDKTLEQSRPEEKEEPGVSKMLAKLAKNEHFDGEPRGIRTPDALIKSQVLYP